MRARSTTACHSIMGREHFTFRFEGMILSTIFIFLRPMSKQAVVTCLVTGSRDSAPLEARTKTHVISDSI